MNNNLLLFNISNYGTKFIHELKYQVHNNAKKYSLQTAKEVEGVFIQILLKSMRSSLSKDNLIDNNQSRLYTDIYDQELSKILSKKGMGLTNIILKQLQKTQKT
ncbi:rod-binding protein [Buchnera aphidicola]|uniref:Flgj n=1 Tax=Buchnera aphidicola str. USDA (Myzus persicae) TaxID=1009856 RepID=W0P3M1_BUCMP|nr:rod-binding protein [Buchnera aphidicola]AHG60042.1 Flgj [Buchnera aphidicola str. USDA (Myzus persicae)]AHG60622.1 Flgj [Buchnera aphidicola str. W106 (Myzus persicae)]AHG61194.1 Flgj [Buchnera aphidicola str. G002 (Myzus persicae)]AHG61767.1 Flgj [Buchnera aphidicola str. F009 (Myzus persicae)]WAI03273.1 MAG: rod-binding protein [Buchnera aphidicola (Myzus persicae)]